MITTILVAFFLTQVGVSQESNAIVTGRVLLQDGQPAANVRVALSPAGDPTASKGDLESLANITRTDNSGNYRMEGVQPGRYFVVAGLAALPTYLPGVKARATGTIISVQAGAVLNAQVFRLATSTDTVNLRVQGRVVGSLPQDLAQSAVVLDRLGGDLATRRTTVTFAADGSFEAPSLAPGTYEVYLSNRVVSTFVLSDKNAPDLAIVPRN